DRTSRVTCGNECPSSLKSDDTRISFQGFSSCEPLLCLGQFILHPVPTSRDDMKLGRGERLAEGALDRVAKPSSWLTFARCVGDPRQQPRRFRHHRVHGKCGSEMTNRGVQM